MSLPESLLAPELRAPPPCGTHTGGSGGQRGGLSGQRKHPLPRHQQVSRLTVHMRVQGMLALPLTCLRSPTPPTHPPTHPPGASLTGSPLHGTRWCPCSRPTGTRTPGRAAETRPSSGGRSTGGAAGTGRQGDGSATETASCAAGRACCTSAPSSEQPVRLRPPPCLHACLRRCLSHQAPVPCCACRPERGPERDPSAEPGGLQVGGGVMLVMPTTAQHAAWLILTHPLGHCLAG